VDLFASSGLVDTLRTATDDTVIPVRVLRRADHERSAALRVAPSASTRANAPDVVVELSPRALRLARAAEPPDTVHTRAPRRRGGDATARGRRLDVVA
jgi:hypothetical protein